MPTKIQIRRGTSAQWTSANPVLLSGEQGLETDTRKMKIGDGTTAWNSLPYMRNNSVFTEATEFPDGTVSAPSITNTGDTDTGIYHPDANTIGITTGGVESARFTSTGISSPSLVPYQQFTSAGSILDNIPARVHPAEQLLKEAVWWIDAAHSSADGQNIQNLGWGGSILDARLGSSISADSNDPKYLNWDGSNYIYLPGENANNLTVPDSVELDITGDIDIRVNVAIDDVQGSGVNQSLLAKWSTSAGQRSYQFSLTSTTGLLRFNWTADGSTTNTAESTVVPPWSDGQALWVRVTLDVDNGASGYTVRFFYSTDGVVWSQLGADIIQSGVTSIFSGTNELRIGASHVGSTASTGKFYRAQILNGINGTPVLDIDTSVISSGSQSSFRALTGQTVTINRSTSGRKTVAVTHPCWLFGTDDYMQVADNDLLDFGESDSFTIIVINRLWANYNANGPIIAKRNNSGTSVGWNVRQTSGGTGNFVTVVYDGTNNVTPTSPTAPNSGALSIGVGVRNAQSKLVQTTVNNIIGNASTDTTTSLFNTNIMAIGRYSSDAIYSDMELISAAVFRRALSATEIATLTNYYSGRVA